ncbi:hypothetical protein EON80_16855 [bacterium]|nr:MAG: hypothetical protein EON80_16855 [bacterium]
MSRQTTHRTFAAPSGHRRGRAVNGRFYGRFAVQPSVPRALPTTRATRRNFRNALTVASTSLKTALWSPLAIPAISPDVPQLITRSTPSWKLGKIAQAFIEAGILSDLDWQGDLISSINSDNFGEDLGFFLEGPEDGAFFIEMIHGAPGINTVGYWLSRIEAFMPGVGQDLFHAVTWPSESFFDGMTPIWAYDYAAELFDDWNAGEEMGQKAFEACMPEWVYSYSEPNKDRLKAAAAIAPAASIQDELTNRIRECAQFALEVIRLHDLCGNVNELWRYRMFPSERGIAIRWQYEHDADPTGAIMDYEVDGIRAADEEVTPLCVLIPFGGFNNLPKAIQNLKNVLLLAKAIDGLLELIHDQRPIVLENQIEVEIEPQQVRIRV